ncbi:MAG: hypothetical protein A3J93_01325 [Candidatus Magasanikbacteria bacterium RIFOXYC2_FULL_42_28]|uniref:GH10 domain-containing protein n=1 Tax=Candidatus Magasanikbacteria bacterium RIFOXYC2_FULL_42_28 TaxID=1798704 RepID=A0A1F6NXR6_9BACT|nr:MAG: hypothetical protein A3J93_01325 [Candidatus Magasanikbacteria bacterium RIFOXYC2_FULL_42_28]
MLKKLFIILGVILAIYLVLFFWPITPNKNMTIGVSFDPTYARFLGLDDKIVFNKIIKDWNFKYLRMPAHWDLVEPSSDEYNFGELDYYLNEAKKNNLKVILAMGQKTPRWPECHAPAWAIGLSDQEYSLALDNYLKIVLERYQNNSVIEMWQVENEPFLAFGEKCRKMTAEQLANEVERARATGKPTLVTDSGELSTWHRTAKAGDWFGTTLYRVVWSKLTGYWSYDWLPAGFYRLKTVLTGVNADKFMVSELQAEPWIPTGNFTSVGLEEQNKSMNLERLQKNIDYASAIGVSRAYLWGAEWWTWLAGQGNNDIPDYIKNLDKNTPAD